ncbi:MAG: sigma 54-interacting transcriptional regulator, partial [Candidatus Krumholzibacteriia bacterium]
SRAGRFEAADGGTLHLDEIGDLPASTQGALLRVLEEKRFEKIGSNRSQEADVRIVAATKRHLAEAVREGSFREDLYFRLNVMGIECPPLRERGGDVPILVEHFLNRKVAQGDRVPRIGRSALEKLMTYTWPGNVRELENVLSRAAILAQHREIGESDLELAMDAATGDAGSAGLRLQDVERAHLQHVLDMHGWNRTDAARVLGIDRSTLQRKIVRYELHPPDDREPA